MNENAQKLVNALESGEYKQGKLRLRNSNNQFCCLGVACDIFHKETSEGKWILTDQNIYYFCIDGEELSSGMPSKVCEYFGIKDSLGIYDSSYLSGLFNDNDTGKSFNEIADIIRSEPVGLFV